MALRIPLLLMLLSGLACTGAVTPAEPDGGSPLPPPGENDAGQTPDAGAEAGGVGDGGTGEEACEPFGHFGGAPENTFTLPAPSANGGLYFPDVQASFPEVDWATLDRLYIPAGTYRLINLGNLPDREASRPLVITNHGGQVVIFPPEGSTQGYIWSVRGGSNWVITGRYDPVSQTGHEDFPGHRCGAYANARGRYGFLSDGAYRSGGHMGIGIGSATRFELEYLEITRSGFAGVRADQPKNGDGTVTPFEDVKLHDLYIHDTKSEGIYFGSTQAPPTPLAVGLQIYNNRIVRAGTEALQVQNLGPGTEVHHNVMAFGATDWRAAFQNFQDNNTQVQVRSGTIHFHHNVFLGGASALLNMFSAPEPGDEGRHVAFTDNYFADSLNLGVYLGGTAGDDSSYTFARNAFRGMQFGYDSLNPSATDYDVIFRVGNDVDLPISLTDNVWEGSKRLLQNLTGGDRTVGNVTASGNVNAEVPLLEFVDSGLPAGRSARALEMWTDVATLGPGAPPVTYPVGALVVHDAVLYEALEENTGRVPPDHPEAWRPLPLPKDDLRTKPGTHWAERGVGLMR